jgi:hypothetical protein
VVTAVAIAMSFAACAIPDREGASMIRIIVELKTRTGWSKDAVLATAAELPAFQIDETYEPVPTEPSGDQVAALEEGEELILVRGTADEDKIEELRSAMNVVSVWVDARIEPFDMNTHSQR